MNSYLFIFLGLVCLFLVIELSLHLLFLKLRKRYDLIITGKDKVPKLDRKKLESFFKHGYDSEIGWVRKPNTFKTEDSFSGEKTWHINENGSRENPGHEHLKTKVITFGDSFTFNREVDDDETWQYYLAKATRVNVANFGAGNYGLDQAFLRFGREINNYKNANLIVIGVVPDTIVRNLTVWKHYSEFGNTFGFKPRFILERGKLRLIENPAKNKDNFYDLKKIIPVVNKYDYFYKSFKENLFTFPYTFSILKSPRKKLFLLFVYGIRYFFELVNFDWRKLKSPKVEKAKKKAFSFIVENRIKGFEDKGIRNLTLEILKEFARQSKERNMSIVFLIMPQKEDLDYILDRKKVYYGEFTKEVEKFMPCINFTEAILKLKDPLSVFPNKKFSENYVVYGGHYNAFGNELVAKEIKKLITNNKIKLK